MRRSAVAQYVSSADNYVDIGGAIDERGISDATRRTYAKPAGRKAAINYFSGLKTRAALQDAIAGIIEGNPPRGGGADGCDWELRSLYFRKEGLPTRIIVVPVGVCDMIRRGIWTGKETTVGPHTNAVDVWLADNLGRPEEPTNLFQFFSNLWQVNLINFRRAFLVFPLLNPDPDAAADQCATRVLCDGNPPKKFVV